MDAKIEEGQIWNFYNGLLLSPDMGRIRKLLVRYELFKKSLIVPGDIVECGVFKGVGALYWLKLLGIFAPASLKKVIGFDTFTHFAESSLDYERISTKKFMNEANFSGMNSDEILSHVSRLGMEDKLELVVGNICETGEEYVRRNPGFRISLLHLDLDTYDGTKSALKAFYNRVVPGGIIIFDEYASHEWGESDAIDEFFHGHEFAIKSVEFSTKPTAYIVKPNHKIT